MTSKLNSSQHITTATSLHGVLLVMACWCTVLAAGLISPLLPQLTAHFSGHQNVELQVGFLATIPALVVAVLALPFGYLIDRLGQRRILLGGLVIYGAFGILPFWLNSLHSIIATRVLVGVGETAVMVASTSMIGLYFSGQQQIRWVGLQVFSANALGIVSMLSGGILGEMNWHAPFLIYAFALLLFVPSFFYLYQPATPPLQPVNDIRDPARTDIRNETRHKRLRLTIYLIGAFSMIAMFTLIIQMALLFPERQADSSSQIGLGIAFGAVGITLGALLVARLSKWHWLTKVSAGFLLYGCGFMLIATVENFWLTALLGLVAGIGGGLIIPSLLSTLMAAAPSGKISRVVGAWVFFTFFAQFMNPPFYIALRDIVGSQSSAIGGFGLLCVILAGVLMYAHNRQFFLTNRC